MPFANKVCKIAIKLCVGTACVFSSTASYAVGLGKIILHSNLNEALDAQVIIIDTKGIEASDLLVSIAPPEDYVKSGYDLPHWANNLHFDIVPGANPTQMVINVRTEDPIRDPYGDLLLLLNWPGGKLVREYTLLFDPPNPSIPPKPRLGLSRALKPHVPEHAHELSHPSIPTQGSLKVKPSTAYGPIYHETLWSIAKKLVENSPYTVHQAVMAIVKNNPEEFKQGDIHQMRAGAVLKMPSLEQIAHNSPDIAKNYVDSNKAAEHNAIAVPPLGAPASTGSANALAPHPVSANPADLLAASNGMGDERALKITSPTTGVPTNPDELSQGYKHLQAQNNSLNTLLALKEKEISQLRLELQKIQPTTGHLTKTEMHLSEKDHYAVVYQDGPTKNNPATSLPAPQSQVTKIASQTIAAAPAATKTPPPPVKQEKHFRTLFILVLGAIIAVIAWLQRHFLMHCFQLVQTRVKQKIEDHGKSDMDVFLPSELKENEHIAFDLDKALNAVEKEEKKFFKPQEVLAPKTAPLAAQAPTANTLEDAEALMAYERYDQAEAVLKTLTQNNPRNFEALLRLLELYIITERYSDFELAYQSVPENIATAAPQLAGQIASLAEKVASEKTGLPKVAVIPVTPSMPLTPMPPPKIEAKSKFTLEAIEPPRPQDLPGKISLAQMYIDKGENELAREILLQAITQGTMEQKIQVQNMLEKIKNS